MLAAVDKRWPGVAPFLERSGMDHNAELAARAKQRAQYRLHDELQETRADAGFRKTGYAMRRLSQFNLLGLHLNHGDRRYAASASVIQRQEPRQCLIF